MRAFLSFILHLAIYAAIVVAIIWGIPKYLSTKFGSEHPMAAITSSSMWPVLKAGDLVFIENVSREDLHEGDIVVWQSDAGFTIHRIVKLDTDTFTTKGDANFAEDKPVAYAFVVGRAAMKKNGKPLRIPYAGFLSSVGLAVRSNTLPEPITYERQ